MRQKLAACCAILSLLVGAVATAHADDAKDHATVRAEPVPGGPVSPEDSVSAHFVSEDGDGKVVGLAAVDFGKEKDWTLGFEVSSPFNEKTDEEVELISIDSLGPGATARLFLTFDHFSSQKNTDAIGKTVCDEIGRKARDQEIAKRAVQQRSREEFKELECPDDMISGQWYRLDNPGGAPRT